jgi:hypothetical protein
MGDLRGVTNFSQCSSDNLNPTPNPMTTPAMTVPLREPPRVTILSKTPRDRQALTTDICEDPHQSGTDGMNPHQHMVDEETDHQAGLDGKINYQSGADGNRHLGDGNCQSRSAIMGVLCKQMLAYVKWHQGCYLGIDRLVMDSLGHWLCNRGISVYIDPV